MKKTRLIILSALSALALTSCLLFKDDDITIENNFKEKKPISAQTEPEAHAGDVGSQTIKIDETEALVFKSIVYSNKADNKIENTYKNLTANINPNEGQDYDVDKNNNNFDMYVPKGLNKADDHTVVLFIHGGAWISGLKTHVNPYVKEFTKRGYISATLEYTLLANDFENEHKDLSIFRDLDEIDACLTTMKKCLVEDLGFTGNLSLVIGGVSSGAHLTMLYSYSRGASSAFGAPKFVINAVGPTDIQESVWKAFNYHEGEEEAYAQALEDGIDYDTLSAKADKLRRLPVSGQGYDWTEFYTMKIANGMCAFPYSPAKIESLADANKEHINNPSDPAYVELVSDADSAEKLLSVTYHIPSSAKIPMICAYAGEDSVVGVGQYANLQNALKTNGYVQNVDHSGTTYNNNTFEYYYFKNCGHVNLDSDTTQYNNFIERIVTWLAA